MISYVKQLIERIYDEYISVCKQYIASYLPGTKVIIEGYNLLSHHRVRLSRILGADLEFIV